MTNATFHAGPRQVYILPTRFGYLFAAALVLMLLVSVNYNNGLGYLFTFVFAAIAVVSMHYTQRNVVDLSFTVQPGKVVFAGQQAEFHIEISEHRNRQRTTVWIRSENNEESIDLDAGSTKRIKLEFYPSSRGFHSLPEFYALSIYPFGLLCAWTRKTKPSKQQLVYPQPGPDRPLPLAQTGDIAHISLQAQIGIDEFHNIKEHNITDPISHIHWKHSARGQGLVSKYFKNETIEDTVLRWADAFGTDVEEKISCLCHWVIFSETNNIGYALELPGQFIQTGKGAHHYHKCLKTLALWSPPK